MTDIAMIPTQELRDDRAETITDIALCEKAIALGVTHYGSDGDVQHRLEVNRAILTKIDAELARRGEGDQ